MSDYTNQLARFRFWNRTAITGFLSALPAAYLVGLITRGTVLVTYLPATVFALCFLLVVVGYVRIRLFHCPRCSNRFTVKHAFATNSTGRNCVHCGLSAYSSAQQNIQADAASPRRLT